MSKRLVASLVLAMLGCDGSEPASPAAASPASPPSAPVAPVKPAAPATPPEPVPTTAAAPEPPIAPPAPTVPAEVVPTEVVPTDSAEAPPGEPAAASDPVRITPIAATAITPTWTEIRTFEGSAALEPLDLGIVVDAAGKGFVLGSDGQLVEDAAVLGASERPLVGQSVVEGAWPDDAWRVAAVQGEHAFDVISFYKWRGNRWVAQPFALLEGGDEIRKYDSNDGPLWHVKSPRSGYLVTTGAGIVRVAGAYPSPEDTVSGDFYETRAGAIVAIESAYRPGDLDKLQRGCNPRQKDCTAALERPLPAELSTGSGTPGLAWTAVGKHGVARSFMKKSAGTPKLDHVLVDELRTAEIHALPDGRAIVRLLGTADGVLWVAASGGGDILRRDAKGVWSAVALPPAIAAASEITIALRDAGHLWVLGTIDGKSIAFETTGT